MSRCFRLLGGELQLKSEPGSGSEFYFTVAFPVGALEEEPENADAAAGMTGFVTKPVDSVYLYQVLREAIVR